MSAIIVIDLGKTLSKVSLWSAEGAMLDRQVRPAAPRELGSVRRLDSDGIETWLIEALGRYAREDVRAIIPVGHGAGVVAIEGGSPIFLPLDYEQPIPGHILAAYRDERDPFTVTGSPALPDGLNMGAQLYWMDRLYPRVMAGATLLPWAQYWGWFLTGRATSEVTSLGCHSDLWNPLRGRFSPLAERMGWAKRFAPLVRASDILGPIRDQISARTGLPAGVKVLAGLHDSNAALLAARGFPEIADNEATVLSTGTWFVAMRITAETVDTTKLSERRDCLVNVDAYGKPIPSARFMGGREIESVIEIDTRRVDIKPDQPKLIAAVPEVVRRGAMMRPTLAPGCGPFPTGRGGWIGEPDDWYERRAAMCLYAALVADTSLSLIGSRARLLVEGRFAEADVFVQSLAALRPDTQVYTANAHNDVSFGALRLLDPHLAPQGELVRVPPLKADIAAYADRWRAEVGVFA